MLTTNFIRQNKDRVLAGLRTRNFKEEELSIIDDILAADDARKEAKSSLDDILAERNKMSKEIGGLYKQGKAQEANALKEKVQALKAKAEEVENSLKESEGKLQEMLYTVPNIPHPSVPAGNSDEDNEVYRAWDKDLPDLGDDAKPHWELAKDFNIFDMELGVKIAEAGFILYRKNGARLQRALINFFLDEAGRAGYEEVMPPHLVNTESATATGQLPDKEGQMYVINENRPLYLIPTAEVPVTNILRGDIVNEADLPIKFTGYTPCFRREAGSYGAHVRGLNRVHQFDKVEIVQAAHPDKSYEVLDEMVEHVAGLLDKLELPYRILRLCGGDIGFTSALTFDFECWSAAQKRWLEVSSVSNFETYQANRLKLRYRDENKKTHLAHTLNGSALALARIVATIIENYQTPEGIKVPKVLQGYMGGTEILK